MKPEWPVMFGVAKWLLGSGLIATAVIAWLTKARRLKFIVDVLPSSDGDAGMLKGEKNFTVRKKLPIADLEDSLHKLVVQPRYTYLVVKIISKTSAVFAVEDCEVGVFEKETGLVLWYPPAHVVDGGEKLPASPKTIRRVLEEKSRSATYVFELYGRPLLLAVEVTDDRHDKRRFALHSRWKSVRKQACKASAEREFAAYLHEGFELHGRIDDCFSWKQQNWGDQLVDEIARTAKKPTPPGDA